MPADASSDSNGRARRWTQFARDLDASDVPALVGKALLIAVVLEILLGGNGYLTKLAGFRIREILFALCILWVPFRLFVYRPVRLPWEVWGLMALFMGTTALGMALGYFGGSRPGAILAELKPLSYFFMLPFFAVTIRERTDVLLIAKLIVACGVVLAVAYLGVLAVAHARLIEYTEIYRFLNQSDEFIFRHHPDGPFIGFLYKGAFHICVALLFVLFSENVRDRILALLLAVSVAMTLTRGFALAIIASAAVGTALNRNWIRLPVIALQIALLIGVLILATRAETQIVAQGEQSLSAPWLESWSDTGNSPILLRATDSIRINDIKYVLGNLEPASVLVGRGLGSKIGERERIEMTYLELLAKQGLLGLALWGCVFAYAAFLYLTLPTTSKETGLPFLLATIFVFVATSTNTFLTGSIGMAIVFISIAALSALKHSVPTGAAGPADTHQDGQPAGTHP